jgi:hypothetical protein
MGAMTDEAMLTVNFLDGEVLEGQSGDFNLDAPSFQLQVGEVHSNTAAAQVPFTAVKSVRFDGESSNFAFQGVEARKVAIHFNGGEVVRGYLEDSIITGQHALALKLHNPDRTHSEVVAIPHAAIKGIFFLKTWQGERSTESPKEPSEPYLRGRVYAPLVDIISEIEALGRLKDDNIITPAEFAQRREELLAKI